MAKYVKGQSGNPSGKPVGTLNKQTREVKEVINYLVSALKDGDLDDMLNYLKREKPEAVLNFLSKIAPKDLTVTNINDPPNPIAEELRKMREGG